jgi:signal transduction histidine kinase
MVRIAGGKGAFLESYSSDIFRSYPRISLGLTEHDIALLEYADERLVASSSDEIPKGIPLPRSLRDSRHSPESIWLDEHIGEGVYKLFFFRDFANPNGTIWYALGFEKSGTQWELFLHLKFFLFYLIVSIVMIGTVLLWLFVRGNRIVLNFKTKLLAAFLLVSLIPVILLAYYNRYYAEERARQDLGKALSEQTSLIVSEIQRMVVMNAPVDLSVVNDRDCATITERLGTGFSIYRGSYIHATSMPELFTAELIDPWLPADAVLHVLLREQGFYFQQQTIGTYQYFIGYRPIYTQAGSINGIVAVPSLYRYTDVERELIERNVYLFGAYAIILLISIAVGILFTNQLYHPLRRLQKATEIIASGKFDIGITKRRSDEFGDLEESFIHMTQDLREAQMQIIKAEREAAWKEMAKQVAHEIKNPLTPMKLSIQHIEKAYRDGAKNFDEILHQVTQTILQQIEILSNIATEFSRMAKMPDRKIEKVDTNRILEEACNLFSQYGGIRSSFDLKAVSPVIYADKEELQRMFVNILRNAVQAMQEEGDITVESSADDTMVDIRISDTGPGIPEGVLSHIFDPYFSTKKEGMGLGLTLVKKTIEDLWGTIEIRSTVGKGTTVHIRLPLTGRERQ